ncbi:MAG: Uma2 family endonuclease [Acidobacteria bacterium]|nr:Uma2 family endonuclease [Acidobacteriota bacterium]
MRTASLEGVVATTVLVPVAEYLGQVFHPDREFLEGVLVERNTGEVDHSDVQTALAALLRAEKRSFWAGVEVRVQVKAERFRIPDVTIVRGTKPRTRIITSPPEVAVEVLSPEDRAGDLRHKIDDYLAFGIPCVWVIDPAGGRGWIHADGGSREAKDGVLRNLAGDLEVPLAALFS